MSEVEAIQKRINREGLSKELHLELIQAKRREKGMPPYVPMSARMTAFHASRVVPSVSRRKGKG